MSDASCLCNDASFVSGTTACIEQTCQGANLTAALQLGQQICSAVVRLISFLVTLQIYSAGLFLVFQGVTLTASSTASSTGSGSGSTPTSSASSSGSAPATTSSAAAAAHGANAFIGLAAAGLVAALAL